MKNGLIGILNTLSKKTNGIKYQFLSKSFSGFKAIPANGKRWRKGESPEIVEIKYLGHYKDALQLLKGKDSEEMALIVWVPRKEFWKLVESNPD